MVVEDLATGYSIIHRLDPRVKIITAVLFSVVVALADRWTCLAMAVFFSMLLIVLSRVSLKQLVLRLLAVNSLIVFLWLILPFTSGGEVLFSIGPLEASREGVASCLLITVKSNTIVLALIALLATTPIMALGHALSHLHVPDKLIHLYFFTFRYLEVIHQEYQRLRNAMRVRGFKPGTNLHTYRSFAYLIGMLLIKSFDRAERIHKAMLCRGFHGKFHLLNHFALRRTDFIMLVLMLMVVGCMAALQWVTLN